MPPAGGEVARRGAPPQHQARTTALPGLAGTTAVPASSALIVRARILRAWLEPLTPSLAAPLHQRIKSRLLRSSILVVYQDVHASILAR